MDNKFAQFEIGDLKNVVQVSIEDEETYLKDRSEKQRKKVLLQTTQGDFDRDYMNWYAVIENIGGKVDALVLVRKN